MKKTLIFSVIFFTAKSIFAQDTAIVAATPEPALKISGSVDAYYRYDFSNPMEGTNSYSSFTSAHNSFELGMASIKAEHAFGKANAVIDLGFGKRAEEFAYADPDHSTLFAVKQAYLSYAVSDKFKLTMGKWATHVGYELVDAYLNRNYSMSYMFSYGPFSHTGLKADISLGGKSALMLGVANVTDAVTTDLSPKFILGQFSTGSKDDKFKAYLNYVGGSVHEYKLNQGDVVLTYAVSSTFSLGYNGTVQSRKYKDESNGDDAVSWWGSALYANLDPTSNFGLTLRGEYLNDKKSLLGFDTNIFTLTLSPNIKVGNLTIIPEIRFENAKDEIYEKHDGDFAKTTVAGILAAVYHF